MVLFILILIIFGFAASAHWWILAKDAPYVPLETNVISKVLQLANPTPADIMYDLGSGDARTLIASVLKFNHHAVGVEINSLRYWYSKIWIRLLRLHHRINIIKGDIFTTPLHKATIVIAYLLPHTHEKLKPKFLRELKLGTKIIAVAFPLAGWQPVDINPQGNQFGPIYLYQIGLSEPK